MVFVAECVSFSLGLGSRCYKRHLDPGARGDTHVLAQAEDRVEHSTLAVAQVSIRHHSERLAAPARRRAPPPQEGCPVGLILLGKGRAKSACGAVIVS